MCLIFSIIGLLVGIFLFIAGFNPQSSRAFDTYSGIILAVISGIYLVRWFVVKLMDANDPAQPVQITPSSRSSSQQNEMLEIVFVDEGMATASSFLYSLAGGTSIENCKLVARVSSPSGTYDLTSVRFVKPYFGSESVRQESQEGDEALKQLRREIESRGWRLVSEQRSNWYSYRYQLSQHTPASEIWIDAFEKGLDLYEAERYEDALKALNEAIRLEPSNAKIHNIKGMTLFQLERDEDAVKAFDEAIRLNPNDVESHTGKGVALATLGQREAALRSINEALRLNPKNKNALAAKKDFFG